MKLIEGVAATIGLIAAGVTVVQFILAEVRIRRREKKSKQLRE
jgi:hypothetical protein